MDYTKEQLLGLQFIQYSNTYIILDDGTPNGLMFENPTKEVGHYYKDYNVKKVNKMIRDNNITLITFPNTEPKYEIY